MISRFLSFVFVLSLFVVIATAQQPYIGDKKIYYGAAYYPESWPDSLVEEDIAYMKELRMNVVRMGEFSWALMEPEPGVYQWDWLHRLIDKLHENGIDVILGTPTATPPGWFWEKHPEVYNIDDDGKKNTHGARRHCSYTSEVFREYTRQICEAMAREFGDKPGVIAWQTDNEFSHHMSFDQETEMRWHKWLKDRYETIDQLNAKWNTILWSQSYSDFSQVPMNRSYMWHNPSLRMAWNRFVNDMIVAYQDIHIQSIRKYSDLPITHDGMPGQVTDYEKVFKDLDYFAVNAYHSFEAYNRIQSNYDRARGYQMGYHWLFETAPNNSGGGPQGQTWFLHQPDNSFFAALWMNYALGGQGAMFWLWRQHWAGHEMPHGSVLSSWGKPTANFDDLKTLGEQLHKTSVWQMNNPVAPAQTAIVWSHENLYGLKHEQYANGLRYYVDWTYRFYRPVSDAFIHRDVINMSHDLSGYKLLMIPLLPMMTEDFQLRVMDWVEKGGILIMGPMSAYRNNEWASYTNHAYGDFGRWTGIEVDSRIPIGTSLREAEIPIRIHFDERLSIPSSEGRLWSEALSSEKGTALAHYETGMHDGKNAIMENRVGKGKVVVLGVDPGYEAYQKIVLHYADAVGVEPIASGDADVVVAPRRGESDGFIIVNIANEAKEITLPAGRYQNLLEDIAVEGGAIQLAPYAVLVLDKEE